MPAHSGKIKITIWFFTSNNVSGATNLILQDVSRGPTLVRTCYDIACSNNAIEFLNELVRYSPELFFTACIDYCNTFIDKNGVQVHQECVTNFWCFVFKKFLIFVNWLSLKLFLAMQEVLHLLSWYIHLSVKQKNYNVPKYKEFKEGCSALK